MRTLVLSLPRGGEKSAVYCGAGAFSALKERLSAVRSGLIFTDSNVSSLYREEIGALGLPVHVMPAGEAHKTEEELFALLRAMCCAQLNRSSLLVAMGGGVVGDVGGLAASLYMRGVSCIQVPTTLLAQVDSSVGGKTAINFCAKNLIGAFKQPDEVYADPLFFSTLPRREISCGLGEIIKHAALDKELFSRVEENKSRLYDLAFLAQIVPDNIAYKASVVERDPHEEGLRKCLNLGHTTAHAFELSLKTLSHGECVLLGLLFENALASRHGGADGVFSAKLRELCLAVLGKVTLPDMEEAARLALLDKKNDLAGTVTLAAPVNAGEYRLIRLPFGEYVRELKEIGGELC